LAGLCLCHGCASIPDSLKEKPPENAYLQYLKMNMAMQEEIYAATYRGVVFTVETTAGSRRVQELLDLTGTRQLALQLTHGVADDRLQAERLYRYVTTSFRYVRMPELWMSAAEARHLGYGDCKSLSLLLLSLMINCGFDAYAAVGHGHMWVSVKIGERWHVFETDTDPARRAIYGQPDFYRYPLFRIFPDRTEKRKRKPETCLPPS